MREKRWFPPSKTRQTLLTFQGGPSSSGLQKSSVLSQTTATRSPPPRPAPDLPNEVWEQILEPLGTIALKKARLVCRDWCIIGTERLFETIYLNNYEKSWSGLVSISKSPHAVRVRSVVWNPLLLYKSCADATIWRSNYQNLLNGLSHHDTLHYYEAYSQVRRNYRAFSRSTSLESAAEALRRLENCHHATISDDYDFESACTDMHLRNSIQNLPDLLPSPGIWGLRPRRGVEVHEKLDAIEAGLEMFKVLQQCPNVTSLTLDCWDTHLDHMSEHLIGFNTTQYIRFGSIKAAGSIDATRNPYVTSVCCRLKVPDRSCCGDGWDYGLGWVGGREAAFVCMRNFSSLRDVVLEVAFSEPWNSATGTVQGAKSGRSEDDQGSDTSEAISTLDDSYGDEFVPFVERRSDGFTEDMFKSLSSKVLLWFTPFPSLRALTLCNVSLSAKSLVCWLCCQEQLPVCSFSLTLQGIVIFYELDQRAFFPCLQQLNVQILYKPENTFYYPPKDSARTPHWDCLPYLVCITGGRSLYGANHANSLDEHEFSTPPAEMPPCPSRETQQRDPHATEIVHRPHEYSVGEADLRRIATGDVDYIHQYYAIRNVGTVTRWDWLSHQDALDATIRSGEDELYFLHSLVVRPEDSYPDDDGFLYYIEERTEELNLEDAIATEEQREAQIQQMVEQYETECLGLDIIQREAQIQQMVEQYDVIQSNQDWECEVEYENTLLEKAQEPDRIWQQQQSLLQYEAELLCTNLFSDHQTWTAELTYELEILADQSHLQKERARKEREQQRLLYQYETELMAIDQLHDPRCRSCDRCWSWEGELTDVP